MNFEIKTYLERLAQSKKRPNSFLFFGADDRQKVEAAEFFVSKLAEKENDAEFLRRMREKIHPDVTAIEPETVEDKKGRIREKMIAIEQVRDAMERLKYFPYELENKFCIVKCAEKLNSESANALLKALEEPAANACFILLASGVESVLPTIVSRCAVLRFPETELPDWKEENREKMKKIFREDIFERFGYIEKISKDRREFLGILADWEAVTAASLRKVVGDDQRKIKKVVGILENLRGAINKIEQTNVNPRAAGERLMLEMGSG
jgi:DNA polymerase III delta prime subunit